MFKVFWDIFLIKKIWFSIFSFFYLTNRVLEYYKKNISVIFFYLMPKKYLKIQIGSFGMNQLPLERPIKEQTFCQGRPRTYFFQTKTF